jgi:hypothetical protein
LVTAPPQGAIFVEGPAGSGKTTAGVSRLVHVLEAEVAASEVLLLVPQRTLATPYQEALQGPQVRDGGQVTIATLGGLAQRMVDLFWPLVSEDAGFGRPDEPPTFLTLETAQYTMARLVRPLLDQEGYFESVVIDRNRLYSQIIDNLNKAAVVGFPYTEIGERLQASWGGERSQLRVFEEAQACAVRFRQYCLAHNLLDFSLQVETFLKYLWPMPLCRNYLLRTYRHLFVDNLEEDTPVTHDLLRAWLPEAESAFLIYDQQAGYRRFLGADPEGGRALRQLCERQVALDHSWVNSPAMEAFGEALSRSLRRDVSTTAPLEERVRDALVYETHRYHPQMLDWVAKRIAHLVHDEDVPPEEIVVLAPFLSGALRFSLMERLERLDVPARSHRPSRPLRDEPATRCLLTLSALAHPAWGHCPGTFDVAYALMQAIEDMDLVRAQLLAQIVYRVQDGVPRLTSFDEIVPTMQERLTYVLGERYEHLRTWLASYVADAGTVPEEVRAHVPLDHFLSRLFGEVLSQPGFAFHRAYDAGEVAANLIESVQKFRWLTDGQVLESGTSPGQEYVEMVEDGVIAAQYVRSWRLPSERAVLLAPAYTFLMRNRPVDVQFWLNAGGRGWWERLYQPLTHPYVLSRQWPKDAVWSDSDEMAAREDALYRLALGLVRRCRRTVYLGLSELGEQGYEQKGPLLQAIQRVLRRLPAEEGADV